MTSSSLVGQLQDELLGLTVDGNRPLNRSGRTVRARCEVIGCPIERDVHGSVRVDRRRRIERRRELAGVVLQSRVSRESLWLLRAQNGRKDSVGLEELSTELHPLLLHVLLVGEEAVLCLSVRKVGDGIVEVLLVLREIKDFLREVVEHLFEHRRHESRIRVHESDDRLELRFGREVLVVGLYSLCRLPLLRLLLSLTG